MKNALRRAHWVLVAVCLSATSSWSEDWGNAPAVSGTYVFGTDPVVGIQCHSSLTTIVAGPPCPAGSTLSGADTVLRQYLPTLPAAVSAPNSGAVILVQGTVVDPTSPSGTGYSKLYANVSLSSFARSDTVDALQGQLTLLNSGVTNLQSQMNNSASLASVSALQSQMDAMTGTLTSLNARVAAVEATASSISQIELHIDDVKRRSDENAVMAAALSPMTPSDGKSNRLGLNGAMIADQSAIALNYTHVAEDIDFSAGVAVSGDSAMAKAGVGISW